MFWKKDSDKEMDKIVNKVYPCFKPATYELYIKDGKSQLKVILSSYEKIVGKQKDIVNYTLIIQAYMRVINLKGSGWTDDEKLKGSLLVNYEKIINRDNIDKIYSFIIKNIDNHEYIL